MASLSHDAGRLQPGGARAHDSNAAACGCTTRPPCGFALAAELGVVRFRQRLADMNLAPGKIVEARRPNALDVAVARLRRPVGVCDQRPCHADQIADAIRDGGFSLRGRRDAADRHHWHAGSRESHLLMDVEEMPAPEMHIRRMIFQAKAETALAVSKVVEQTR